MKRIDTVDVTDKKVIVRVDWNVTLGKALEVIDDTRIRKTLPTIQWLWDHGAQQVILISHLGKAEEKKSLKPVVEYAEKIVGRTIVLFDQLTTKPVDPLVMLENVRLFEGEDTNDSTFAQKLAALGDMYVNEAFGEAHRESASIVGIPRVLPSYAGLWFVEELEAVLKVRDNPGRPFVVIMGGAKVDDKIKLLEVLSRTADVILLGGKLANEFVQKGMELSGMARVVVPVEGNNLFDIGPQTRELYAREIARARTVVWNGPMGKIEDEEYRAGTTALYEALAANESSYTVVGGGDTLSAIGKLEHLERIDHISTGGGAMLALLEAGTLPGIEALA